MGRGGANNSEKSEWTQVSGKDIIYLLKLMLDEKDRAVQINHTNHKRLETSPSFLALVEIV